MKFERTLEKARVIVSRQFGREIKHVDAIYDDELWKILEWYGLLAKLDAGELSCPMTGVQLSRANVGGLIGSEEGPQLISDSMASSEISNSA